MSIMLPQKGECVPLKKGGTVTKGDTNATFSLRPIPLGLPQAILFCSEEPLPSERFVVIRRYLMFLVGLGAVVFGLLIGWIAYRLLRQRSGPAWLANLIALLGMIAGAAALAFFRDNTIFGWYAIGLVLGFFGYFTVGVILYGKQEVLPWLPEQPVSAPTPTPGA